MMMLRVLLLALLWAAPIHAAPPRPTLVRETFRSKALGEQRAYTAWIPADGAALEHAKDRTYPLVVLLHGLGGEGADWFDPQLGDIGETLAALIAAERLPPIIAIAPDGGNGYWTDHFKRKRAGYGTLIDEAIADAEARFPLDGRRVIVGVSMGGHGAMSAALRAPGRYLAVVSVAGALFSEPPTHRKVYKQVWGDPADPEHWRATSPVALASSMAPANAPAIFLSCGRGDVDRFLDLTLRFAKLLENRGIPHTLVLTDGAHDWTTWRSVQAQWLGWLGGLLRETSAKR
jgi:S-formylglutathione hydrolase FrmB